MDQDHILYQQFIANINGWIIFLFQVRQPIVEIIANFSLI